MLHFRLPQLWHLAPLAPQLWGEHEFKVPTWGMRGGEKDLCIHRPLNQGDLGNLNKVCMSWYNAFGFAAHTAW
jgi:hypothetical protein